MSGRGLDWLHLVHGWLISSLFDNLLDRLDDWFLSNWLLAHWFVDKLVWFLGNGFGGWFLST